MRRRGNGSDFDYIVIGAGSAGRMCRQTQSPRIYRRHRSIRKYFLPVILGENTEHLELCLRYSLIECQGRNWRLQTLSRDLGFDKCGAPLPPWQLSNYIDPIAFSEHSTPQDTICHLRFTALECWQVSQNMPSHGLCPFASAQMPLHHREKAQRQKFS